MSETLAATTPRLELRVDESLEAEAWDRFLERIPSGHHTQTSQWARVKATVGWRALRVMAVRDDVIVAGAQLLVRRVPGLGLIGYIANGPVTAPTEDAAAEVVLDEVERVVRHRRIRHVTIQPPLDSTTPTSPTSRRYLTSNSQVAPAATVIVDLEHDLETLLEQMRRKTRYNVRLSSRKGITVRSGDFTDIGEYHRMVEATAKRQGFQSFPREYFDEMWRVLNPGGHLRLAIAEYDGNPVAAQMAIAFGSTVVNKLSVWSGKDGNRRPNEAIQWSTMRWAKERGYERYDLEGIDIEAARLLLNERPLPQSFDQTVTSFKLGFGGRVMIAPEPHEYLYSPVTRWLYAEVSPHLRRRRAVKRFMKRLRTGSR